MNSTTKEEMAAVIIATSVSFGKIVDEMKPNMSNEERKMWFKKFEGYITASLRFEGISDAAERLIKETRL